MLVRLLALLPFVGILVGIQFVNRVTPLVLGMPLPLAWLVGWVILTSVIMAIIYVHDPANQESGAESATTESVSGEENPGEMNA